MVEIGDKDFERLVGEGIDAIPEKYLKRLENVAFLVENEPSPAQRQQLKLGPDDLLFGLYEGVPLVERSGTTRLLPDKITLFKYPLTLVSRDINDLRERIRHTIWHEVAHYFGLDHKRIHELDSGLSVDNV